MPKTLGMSILQHSDLPSSLKQSSLGTKRHLAAFHIGLSGIQPRPGNSGNLSRGVCCVISSDLVHAEFNNLRPSSASAWLSLKLVSSESSISCALPNTLRVIWLPTFEAKCKVMKVFSVHQGKPACADKQAARVHGRSVFHLFVWLL